MKPAMIMHLTMVVVADALPKVVNYRLVPIAF
jgi:hypothetical protein